MCTEVAPINSGSGTVAPLPGKGSGNVVPMAGAKAKELQVFLFEQNIIFSEAVGKRTQFTDPMYIYKAHIQVSTSFCTMSERLEVA